MVVWITPKWPFPVTDGARIATTQLLSQLTRRGLKVHLCSIVPEGEEVNLEEAKASLGIDQVTLVRKKPSSRLRLLLHWIRRPFFPVTLAPYATAEVEAQVKDCLKESAPKLVVYDGLHSASWMNQTIRNQLQIDEVYRAHNVESEIWFCAARNTSNPFKKALLYFQGLAVERVEKELARESKYVFPVSFIDERKFKEYQPSGTLQTLPIGVQTAASSIHVKKEESERRILFIGKLDWPPNRDGLAWFLSRVWPKAVEQAPDLSLNIVGSGDQAWLEKYRSLPGVHIIGRVDRVADYYENCIASIVPIFYGSGTRVKAIESSLFGRACLSTELGVEGLGLEPNQTFYHAETPEQWIQTLVSLHSGRALEMGERARNYASRVFDPLLIADQFLKTTQRN